MMTFCDYHLCLGTTEFVLLSIQDFQKLNQFNTLALIVLALRI